MSSLLCTHTKANGGPCEAHSLPDSHFCLFHDPTHTDALAAGRSRGGSTPRRRSRRFPLVLDHLNVAELWSELFLDALNHSESIDTKRLQALTRLAQVILKAVGAPKDSPFVHADRAEPSADQDHLLRFYPSLAPEIEAVLAADCPRRPNDQPLPSPHVPTPEPATSPANEALTPNDAGSHRSRTFLGAQVRRRKQAAEQVANRAGTSSPASEALPSGDDWLLAAGNRQEANPLPAQLSSFLSWSELRALAAPSPRSARSACGPGVAHR